MSKTKKRQPKLGAAKTSTPKPRAPEVTAVMSAQGTWCVGGGARSNVVQALAKLRNFPPDIQRTLGPELSTTVAALEAAIGSPVPLELEVYYQLVASFEETMARTMQTLLDMAPPDETSPNILVTMHLALARAECFRHFASIATDVEKAKEFLLPVSGTYAQLHDSLASNPKVVLPDDAEGVVSELQTLANEIERRDPAIAVYARRLAAQVSGKVPLPLATFLDKRAELSRLFGAFNGKYVFQCDDMLALVVSDPRLVEMREGLMAQVRFHARAAAACEFLASIYRPRARAMSEAPKAPLVLN